MAARSPPSPTPTPAWSAAILRASFTGGPTTSATSSSPVGSDSINQGTLAATGNYTIGTFKPATLTVQPAPLTVTANTESTSYGSTVPALTYTYSGLVNDDTSASFTGGLTTSATSSSPLGSYSINQGTLAAIGNYTIGAFKPATLTVQPALLTVTANAESMTYGGTVPALTYAYSGLVNGDTSASFTGGPTTSATSSSPVDSYSINQGTLAATGNYTIGTFKPATLTVQPAPLTVTANTESVTYGGTVPALAYTYSGLVNGDTSATFTGGPTTSATSSSPVDSYSINQGTLAATGNYTIGTFKPATLTVVQAPLRITANDVTKVYGAGAAGVDGELQRFRQRRHTRHPHHGTDADDHRHRLQPGDARGVRDHGLRRGRPELRHHLCTGTLTVTPATPTLSVSAPGGPTTAARSRRRSRSPARATRTRPPPAWRTSLRS